MWAEIWFQIFCFLRLALWPNIMLTLVNVLWVLEIKLYCSCLSGVFYKINSLRLVDSVIHVFCISSFTIYLFFSITEKWELNSLNLMMELFIFPLSSISFCFMHIKVLLWSIHLGFFHLLTELSLYHYELFLFISDDPCCYGIYCV